MADGTRAQNFEVEINNLVNSNHKEFLDFTVSVNDNFNKMSEQIQMLLTELRNGRDGEAPEEQNPVQRSLALDRGLNQGLLGAASSSGQTSSLGRVQHSHQGVLCNEIQSSTAKMDDIRIQHDRDDCVEFDDKDNIWGEKNEKLFIELMFEEVKKGNLATTTFSKTGSRNIARDLKERVGKEFTHNQLKNKYRNLRARQKKFKALIKETGIGYNSQTGEVSASEEVHSLALRFKKKSCKEFKQLCLVFGDTTAIENHQRASIKLPSDSEDESRDFEDSEDDDTELDGNGRNKSKVSAPKKKKVKRTYSRVFENALHTVGEQSKRRIDLLEQKIQVPSVRDSTLYMVKRRRTVLDLGGNAYGKAVKALHDSTLYRKIFLRMSDERKKDWVLSL